MSSTNHQELRAGLAAIKGMTIQAACLLIWPSEVPDETSTLLNLRLLGDGRELSVTLRTAPDGQTPMLEYGRVKPAYEQSDLPARQSEWMRPEFWSDETGFPIEAFAISGNEEFGDLIGATITTIDLVCTEEAPQDPVGIKLYLSSGGAVFSIAGTYGNELVRSLTPDWFPFAVMLVPS